MTRDEFMDKISEFPEKQNLFILDSALVEGKLNLYKNGSKWIYYFYERGGCHGIRNFKTESEALDALYSDLTKPTSKLEKIPGYTLVYNYTGIGPSEYFIPDEDAEKLQRH